MSFRYVDGDSPFIKYLVEEIKKSHARKDFLSILTDVSNEVALKFTHGSTDQKQMPTVVSTLTKKFMLTYNV